MKLTNVLILLVLYKKDFWQDLQTCEMFFDTTSI